MVDGGLTHPTVPNPNGEPDSTTCRRIRMRRLLAAVAIASLFVVVGPADDARACSCAMSDPASQLEQSEAAFVGKLLERPDQAAAPDGFSAIWVFEVEEWVKGDLGEQVGVHSGLGGGDCGLEMNVGDRAGVFLYNDNGQPSSGLCSVTTPEAMVAANRPLVFDGTGPPVFLVAADTGRTRLATLDARGRLLTAVADDRFGWSVSVCPEEKLIVDVVEGEVTLRGLDLEPVRTVATGKARPEQVWCLDADGERILAQTWDEAGAFPSVRILGEPEPVHSGEIYYMDVSPTHLALVTGPVNASVDVIDLATGERQRIVGGLDVSTLAFSPSGESLMIGVATPHRDGGYQTEAAVYDVATGETTWISPPLIDSSVYDWVDESRLWGDTYPLDAETPTGLIVDTRDGTTTAIRTVGSGYLAVAGSLVSVSEGRLLVTSPDGTTTSFASLPTPTHRLVAVLDKEATLTVSDTTTLPSDEPTTSPEQSADASFPTAVAAAALGGVALILVVGWRAIRRRRI